MSNADGSYSPPAGSWSSRRRRSSRFEIKRTRQIFNKHLLSDTLDRNFLVVNNHQLFNWPHHDTRTLDAAWQSYPPPLSARRQTPFNLYFCPSISISISGQPVVVRRPRMPTMSSRWIPQTVNGHVNADILSPLPRTGDSLRRRGGEVLGAANCFRRKALI